MLDPDRRRQSGRAQPDGHRLTTYPEPIRVLVADDYPAVRSALASLVESTEGLELAGCAADADEAIEIAAREQPDVALVDLRMPAGGGPAAARGIAERSPRTRIIALTASPGEGGVGPPFTDRILKGLSTSEIVAVVRRVAAQPTLFGSQP